MNKNDPETLRLMKIPTMIFFMLFQLMLWVPTATGEFTSDLCEHDLFKKTIQHGEMSKQRMEQLKHLQALDKIEESTPDPWDTALFANPDMWNAQKVLKHRNRQGKH